MENEIKPEEFSILTIYLLIKQKIKFFISFVIVVTILVIIYSLIMPNTYQSTATLLPPKKESSGGGLSSFIQNFTGGLDLGGIGQNDQSKLFAHIISSRTVADLVVEDLKLKKVDEFKELSSEKFYKLMQGILSTETDKTGVIYVTGVYKTGYFPGDISKKKAAEYSARFANSAVTALDKVIRERNVSSARKSKEYIETQIVSYRLKLDSVATAFKKFQEKNKVISIDEQANAIVSQAIEVGSELAKAELEYNLAKLEFQNSSPRLEFYQKQLDVLNDQYKKIQSGGLTSYDAFSIPLDSVPSLMKEYADLFRQRKIYEQVILYLETQRHQEAIQEKRDVPVVEILDYARIPEERYSPNRVTMTIFAFVLSFIFGIIIIIIGAFRKGKVYVVDNDLSKLV